MSDEMNHLSFSQRLGFAPAAKVIQSTFIDQDLRIAIWNCLTQTYWATYDPPYRGSSHVHGSNFEGFCFTLYSNYYKRTVDSIPLSWSNVLAELKNDVLAGIWYQVYDLIEFIADHAPDEFDTYDLFIQNCNKALERENSAFRFVSGKITPITTSEEIASIERAIANSDQYAGVRTHLQTSLGLLTDKLNPDYRNSIKESISAVESLAKKLVGDDKATLGQALKVLEKHHNLHPSLKTAFSALYGYTNDASGIRHSLMDNESALTQADARFMLICCSAFINFAIDSTKS